MARRIVQPATQHSRKTAQRGQRPAASSSQIITLAAVGFVGALLLFVITGAAANRTIDREVIIESSQGDVAAAAAASQPIDPEAPAGSIQPDSTPDAALIAPAPLATALPRPTIQRPTGPYIGIVAGHWGNDSGAVCWDSGTTEQDTNLKIAELVAKKLRERGVWVDLLQEFDTRLNGFSGDVLVSIHADSCDPIDADPPATGFKVARSQASQIPTITDKLVDCLRAEYQKATGMNSHENSITNDMTFYHSFKELDPNTPAVIIETGFLRLDYDMIVKQPERPAEGITNGILCFLKTQL
jgi:N-acetylmuramoyl-L-alanine amidase